MMCASAPRVSSCIWASTFAVNCRLRSCWPWRPAISSMRMSSSSCGRASKSSTANSTKNSYSLLVHGLRCPPRPQPAWPQPASTPRHGHAQHTRSINTTHKQPTHLAAHLRLQGMALNVSLQLPAGVRMCASDACYPRQHGGFPSFRRLGFCAAAPAPG